MMPIVWTETARQDLREIIQYISERNPAAALRIGRSIESSTALLQEHPKLYRMSLRVPNCREIIVHKNYIVLYQEEQDMIRVVNVIHARRNFPA